jgi:hypothetical protein
MPPDGAVSARLPRLACAARFARGSTNLANKMGVPVRAPDDVLWSWPNGATRVSEMEAVTNPVTGQTVQQPKWPPTGSWRDFSPGPRYRHDITLLDAMRVTAPGLHPHEQR